MNKFQKLYEQTIKTGLNWKPMDDWEKVVVDKKYNGTVFYRIKTNGDIKSRKYKNGEEVELSKRMGQGVIDPDEDYNPTEFALSHGK